jgi:arylsulfatase A-like enzyme
MTGSFGHKNGMLTNSSPINFGVEGRRQWRPGDLPTLGNAFQAAGYRCGYVGKWHLGSAAVDPGPLRLGFDDSWTVAYKDVHDYFNWQYCTGATSRLEGTGFRAGAEVDMTIDFMKHSDPRPWFCVLSWGPPHDPLTPPESFKRFKKVPLPPSARAPQVLKMTREILPLYYALIEALDFHFGRLLQSLESLGLAENTLVIYTSDHGNQMGSQDYIGKELPYDESTRVPFLMRWPGRIAPGRVSAMPFGTPDIFPSLAGMVGLPAPTDVQGRDLSDALLDLPGAARQEHVYLAAWDTPVQPWPGWRGVRTEQHLFARTKDHPWMLYDLLEDPQQLRDLRKLDKPLRKELDELTTTLMQQYGDSWG